MAPLVTYRREGKIGYIGLNRPEKLNAINDQMFADYHTALSSFIADGEARVGILYGEGRSFCVGMDLSPAARTAHDGPITDDRENIQGAAEAWLRLWDCPKPVIAQIHGYCIAGGTQLPIFCDLVAVADDATFGWPKVPVGAGYISTMWTWFVGPRVAKEMSFIAGSTMTARRAYETGYANLIFPADELADRTRAKAEEIALMAPELLRIKKLAINRIMELQGFRTAVLFGAEWDAIAHASAPVTEVRGWLRELGMKDAIAKYAAEGL
jgi:enoyl-CoA hydratase